MNLSLKKENMTEYLEAVKAQGEFFICMLWGTVIPDLSNVENLSIFSTGADLIIPNSQNPSYFQFAPDVIEWFNNAMPRAKMKYIRRINAYPSFCYIGLSEKSLYVVAVDRSDTSRIIGTIALPLASITSLKIRKTILGSIILNITGDSSGHAILTIKGTSTGTDIEDQRERMAAFLAAIDALKTDIPG